ncbi:hypothetical protein J7L67_01595 [bacterium]|nr:hypothetical protein [bacterium]
MQKEGFLLLILAIVNVSFALFLSIRGNKSFQRVNKAFSLWIVTICFWYAQQIIKTLPLSENFLEILLRLSLLGIWIIPSFFVYFILCFMHEKISLGKRLMLICPAIIFIMLIMIDFSGLQLIIATTRRNIFGNLSRSIVYKMPVFLLWLGYFLSYSVWGAVLLLGHLKRTAVVLYNLKLRYLILQSNFLLASLAVLAFILGLTLDIIIPIVKSPVFPISSVTTLIMVIFMFILLIRVEQN